MKKIISALCVLTILTLASCSSDNNGEFETFLNPVKGFSVKGLDKKEKATDRDQMTLHVEKNDTLKIQFNPGYGSDKGNYSFTYTSSKPEVATISSIQDGKAAMIKTGKEPGEKETVITVTSINNPTLKYEFTVVVIKNEIKTLTTKVDYSKGMFIRVSKELEIGELVFDPIDASVQDVTFKCADETIAKADSISVPNGKDKDKNDIFKKVMGIKTFKQGKTTLTITPKNKPSAKYEIEVNVIDIYSLDKSAWTIDLVYENIEASKVNKEFLIDGKNDTYMTLGKPGKIEGVSRETKLAFAIDRKNKEEFNTIQLMHNGKDISQRVREVSIFGRDNLLDNWEAVKENVKIKDVEKEDVKSPAIEIPASKFQHIRVDITEWDTKDGGAATLQIAEFNFLGYKAE